MESVIAFLKNLFPTPCHPKVFLVGGIVRDFELGKQGQDIDLAAALPVDTLRSLGFRLVESKSAAPIYFTYRKEFGKIEVTQLADSAALAEDLLRRDFTCNAMAMSLAGELIDPLGGRDDTRNLLLRACTQRSFCDDPVRVFRAFRFEAEGWRLSPETADLIARKDWDETFTGIPVERFSREMLKALGKQKPERFFLRMVEFAVGAPFLPELFRMPQVPAGPVAYHPEGDLLTHAIQVLQRTAAQTPDATARLCAMFHDLGKLATDPALYPRHHGHDEAGSELATSFCRRLCLTVAHRKALAATNRLHLKANNWATLRDATRIRVAGQAVQGGIAEILPRIAANDRPEAAEMADWPVAVRVVGMTTAELGIDQARLQAMAPENRRPFILQKQVEALRRLRKTSGG